MDEVREFFYKIFMAENWPARWHCGKWSDFHGWLYIFSNLAIWLAYFAIPVALFYFLKKREDDIPFKKVFWLFILFILACGTTHLCDAILFYYPAYRFSALILFLTALISWITIFSLLKVLPEAIGIKSPAQLEAIIKERTNEQELLSENLSQQNVKLQNFADITTHNLRSPASNLVGLIHLYKKESNEEKKALYIQKFEEASIHLMDTLNDLYEVVKINKQNNIKKERLDFETVLKSVVNEISTKIENKKGKVTWDFSACKEIEYSKIYLDSIFLNFLTNALQYSSPERPPVIHFTSIVKEGRAVLTCEDNGLGIDMKKYSDKIFRLHKTFHKNPDARGVGLFITKTQIENMGGSISVESEVNVGSKFIVVF
jgi:chemotaxis family two-component system sensor kinase Cph1